MKNAIILLFSLVFLGCNLKENSSSSAEKNTKDSIKFNDSIKFKKTNDSLLISKFKKWIKDKDTSFVNEFFSNDIDTKYDIFDLKFKQNIFSLSLTFYDYNDNRLVGIRIKRFSILDLHLKSIDNYDPTSYFKLNFFDKNSNKTTKEFKKYHANQEQDEDLLRAISENADDKIELEEYFAYESTGHFEGEKAQEGRKIRSFILTDENKQAIKETYLLFLLFGKNK